MWVKICGTTSLQDAELAAEAGADALGFVFAESRRRVTPRAVRAITKHLPEQIERYGVFVNPTFDEVVEAAEEAGLTGVQVHATRDPALTARLRAYWSSQPQPVTMKLLQVLHFTAETLPAELAALSEDYWIDAALIDSHTPNAAGGTGVRFDWQKASAAIRAAAPQLRLIVAGGLSPENVMEAITLMRPWGVDVVTGVEASPGHKDAAKVRTFVQRAREAAAG